VVTSGWALFATVCLVWPGFGKRGDWDVALPPGFVTLDTQGHVVSSQRLVFELTQIAPLLLLVGLGVLFLVLGRRDEARSRTGAIVMPAEPGAAPTVRHLGERPAVDRAA
jgi:hypothetical protein